jgi:hypothetical protein
MISFLLLAILSKKPHEVRPSLPVPAPYVGECVAADRDRNCTLWVDASRALMDSGWEGFPKRIPTAPEGYIGGTDSFPFGQWCKCPHWPIYWWPVTKTPQQRKERAE